MPPYFLYKKNYLQAYLADGLLSQDEFGQLNENELFNLDHELVHRYIKDAIITMDRAKKLSKDEYARITNYCMINYFTKRVLPLEELLMLNTRRAVVLTAPNVVSMITRDLLTVEKAIELDDTFDILDENKSLKLDVLYNDVSPEFALNVGLFYLYVSLRQILTDILDDINEGNSGPECIQLFIDPRTSTQCCTLLSMKDQINEEIATRRSWVIRSTPTEIINYVGCDVSSSFLPFFPPSLHLNLPKIIYQSTGYRDYCISIIQLSFRLMQFSIPADTQLKSGRSLRNRDRCFKEIGNHEFSMWQSNYPTLKPVEQEPKTSIALGID